MVEDRMLEYIQKRMTGVAHVTLDPEGPGVVRIHLIPPRLERKPYSFKRKLVFGKKNNETYPCSIAIINGRDIIPVNYSWAVILNELITQLNIAAPIGEKIKNVDFHDIVEKTVSEVKKVFPAVSKKKVRSDLWRIVNAFCDISRGQIPEENIGLMTMKEYEPFMNAPHRMDLMISAMEKNDKWNCNNKCLHCYAAGQCESSQKELSLEKWKIVLDRLREIGVPQVTFTGGEPTMRSDDLVELVDHAKWFVTRLNTNGIKMTPDLCKRLVNAGLDSVQFTLYSADEAIHNELVGTNTYKMTVEGLKNAMYAGLNVSVNTPLCTINKDYVRTLRFLNNRGVKYVTCSGLIITGNACKEESQRTQLSETELFEILKEAKKFCDETGMEISFTSPGWLDSSDFKEIGISEPTCGAGFSNMAIAPNGDVVLCQSWLSDEPLGNILTDSWEEMWMSNKCAIARKYSAGEFHRCPLKDRNQGGSN